MTGSEQSVAQIRDWYTKCKSGHPDCNNRITGATSDWKPTRVINIGLLNTAQEPFLEVPKNGSPPFSYVTLSHCWGPAGGPKPPTLTVANLDAMRQQIPMETLPRTFTDAISVARELNIQYLWIDSLCIVQDSAEDWPCESGQMNMVYQRAAFNVSADAAGDCEGGLFFERDPKKLGVFTLNATQTASLIDDSYVCHTQHYIRDAMRLKLNRPLISRGWVYQERMLSLRQISFCSDQIYWNYTHAEACEVLPIFHVKRPMGFEDCVRQTLSELRFKRDKIFLSWYKTVEEYTLCALSEIRDRLVAIQGLANVYRASLRSEYLAGLWKERLEWELLWAMENGLQSNGEPAFRPQTYRAPTWSWASVEGQVRFKKEMEAKSLIQILDVITAANQSTIKLRGTLVDIRECSFSSMQDYIAFGNLTRDAAESWVHCFIDDRKQWVPDDSFLLPLIVAAKERFGSYVRGLVLSRADEGQNYFKRVGVFTSANPRKDGAGYKSTNLEGYLSRQEEQTVTLI